MEINYPGRDDIVGEYSSVIRSHFQSVHSQGHGKALYFYAFTQDEAVSLRTNILNALERLGGNQISVDCANKKYSDILGEIIMHFGRHGRTVQERYKQFESALNNEPAFTLLLLNLSMIKATKHDRLYCAQEIIKSFYDDVWRGSPKSGLIIVDTPSFLEEGATCVYPYVRPFAVFDKIAHFLDANFGPPVPETPTIV